MPLRPPWTLYVETTSRKRFPMPLSAVYSILATKEQLTHNTRARRRPPPVRTDSAQWTERASEEYTKLGRKSGGEDGGGTGGDGKGMGLIKHYRQEGNSQTIIKD